MLSNKNANQRQRQTNQVFLFTYSYIFCILEYVILIKGQMMLKRYVKIISAVMAVIIISALLAGCGSADLSKPKMKEGAVTVPVKGSCDISVENGKITVSGETDLLPGSILYVSVEAQNGMTLSYVKMTKGDANTVSHEFTINEKYDDSVKTVTGHISCAPTLYGKHAEIVYETYGDKFENIVTEDDSLVWNSNGVIVVFASDAVALTK